MHKTLYHSKPFRTLKIIDESNREILAIETNTSRHVARVVRALEQPCEIYGLLQAMRFDNVLNYDQQSSFDGVRAKDVDCVTSSPVS
jgi:hypothetical protein